MVKSPETRLPRSTCLAAGIALLVAAWPGSVPAAEPDVPEVPVIAVSPESRDMDSLLPNWGKPRRPPPLGGRERQAILQQVSGGGQGGLPLLNTIQTQGRTPDLRQAILTVKRPWYVHRAFLSAEGVQRVDARSVMRFDESIPGRAVVGLNLNVGHTYLIDFLVKGEGKGDYSVETSAGIQPFPDPKGERTHVLVALDAQESGWTEVSLRRDGGAFDLHSVEVTLARGPNEESESN